MEVPRLGEHNDQQKTQKGGTRDQGQGGIKRVNPKERIDKHEEKKK